MTFYCNFFCEKYRTLVKCNIWYPGHDPPYL